MKDIIYDSKEEKINILIETLYQSSEEIKYEDICKLLDEIYLDDNGEINENFRHEYSKISGQMRSLNDYEEQNGINPYLLETLLVNVEEMYKYIVEKEMPYAKLFFKLRDHINLEAGRINLVEGLKEQILYSQNSVSHNISSLNEVANVLKGSIDTYGNTIEKLEEQTKENEVATLKNKDLAEENEKVLKRTKDKIENVHRDSVTILGIFASIVLAFTTGIAYSSSVLKYMNDVSKYRLIFVILVIGFILVNLISIMLGYIDKIRRVEPIEFKYPKAIKYVNTFIIISMIITFVLWLLCRNIM